MKFVGRKPQPFAVNGAIFPVHFQFGRSDTLLTDFLYFGKRHLMTANVPPDGEVARSFLIAVVGAVESPASHTDVTATMRTLGSDSLHIDGTVIGKFQYGREGFSFPTFFFLKQELILAICL